MMVIPLVMALGACDDGVKVVDSCGDGILDPGEECDGPDLGGLDCTAAGFYTGTLGCRSGCTFDTTSCTGRCGDNQLDPAEACEGGELRDQTCETLGFQSGLLSCTNACEYDTVECVGECGDGQKDLNEGCDDGGTVAGDGCSPGCTVDAGWSCAGNPSWCQPVCGDGTLVGDEPCDGEELDGATCESRGFYGGALACASDCTTYDVSGCVGSCGDGTIQADQGEVCEGTNLDGQTCLSLGMSGSGLACDASCQLDTSGCATWSEVSTGASFACAIDGAGAVWCWGSNTEGQCGQAGGGRFTTPVQVPNLPHPAVAISAGYHHACALLEEPGTLIRSLRCWGNNQYGQLGRPIALPYANPIPEDVSGVQGEIDAVSAGNNFTCVLSQGDLWCWGSNDYCELGRGSASIADATPVRVNLGPGTALTDLSCGYMFCVARSDAGAVLSWGSHTYGKLGMNVTSPVCSPSPPTGFANLQYPFAGGEHACALDTQGTPSCWGYNLNGQLGDGTNTDTYQPTPVVSTGVLYLTMDLGAGHTCALDFAGNVWCWGTNTSGENGTGDSSTVSSRNSPARIEAFSRQVVRLSAGYDFSCAIVVGGGLYCWGQNMEGQLGTGDQLTRDVPTPVLFP